MPKRITILADYPEENWPSMDLVAEMLTRELQSDASAHLLAERVCADFKRRATRFSAGAFATNVDRLLNRMRDYPRFASTLHDRFDFFHVCDHSYSQLVHALPAERTGVFCHDLDTFRCILEPARDPRPRWFRGMAQRILRGLQKASIVFHTTDVVRAEILRHGLVDESKLVQAPYGIASEFTTGPSSVDPEVPESFLLHVGSCIPRKRIDVLLDVVAAVRGVVPGIKLLQVGGEWSEGQRAQIERLQLGDSVTQLPRQDRATIAALYQRSRIVLMPSESEGFGLPVAEALACGAIVLASDIPVLREVGGEAAVYCPLAEVGAWSARAVELLRDPDGAPAREVRIARASKYSWRAHASAIASAYLSLRT